MVQAIRENVEKYTDGEVVGVDVDGSLVQWNAKTWEVYNSGETLESFGAHNLSEQERGRLQQGKLGSSIHVSIQNGILTMPDGSSIDLKEIQIALNDAFQESGDHDLMKACDQMSKLTRLEVGPNRELLPSTESEKLAGKSSLILQDAVWLKRKTFPIATSGELKSISDDDLCSSCLNCEYKPGELSSCSKNWPGSEDADGYVQTCDGWVLKTASVQAERTAQQAHQEMEGMSNSPQLHEYGYEVMLKAAIRVKASTPEQAIQMLHSVLDTADCNGGAWSNGDPVHFEASTAPDTAPFLYSIDGEDVAQT